MSTPSQPTQRTQRGAATKGRTNTGGDDPGRALRVEALFEAMRCSIAARRALNAVERGAWVDAHDADAIVDAIELLVNKADHWRRLAR